jgi:hypothetical protein
VIKHVHAKSGPDCMLQCMIQVKLCRSANFRKTCEGQKNCELLEFVDSEEPAESLKNDGNFDHYILLQPERVSTVRIFYKVSVDGNCKQKIIYNFHT